MSAPVYVIWSFEHDAWWGPDRWGYTRELAAAGRYTAGEAAAIVARANIVKTNEQALLLSEAELLSGPPAPLPDGVVMRPATEAEQRAALIAEARRQVAQGAGHDCHEWVVDARCELCDRTIFIS